MCAVLERQPLIGDQISMEDPAIGACGGAIEPSAPQPSTNGSSSASAMRAASSHRDHFNSVPHLLVGTNRISIMHRACALLRPGAGAEDMALAVCPCLRLVEMIQWQITRPAIPGGLALCVYGRRRKARRTRARGAGGGQELAAWMPGIISARSKGCCPWNRIPSPGEVAELPTVMNFSSRTRHLRRPCAEPFPGPSGSAQPPRLRSIRRYRSDPAQATVVDGTGATLMPRHGGRKRHAHLIWPSSVERFVPGMSLPPEGSGPQYRP